MSLYTTICHGLRLRLGMPLLRCLDVRARMEMFWQGGAAWMGLDGRERGEEEWLLRCACCDEGVRGIW